MTVLKRNVNIRPLLITFNLSIKQSCRLRLTFIGVYIMNVNGKIIAEAFAATFENHDLMDDGTAYHTICKGSLVLAGYDSMSNKDFSYFLSLVGIESESILNCYFEVGMEFEKLIKLSTGLPNDIELLACLANLDVEEIMLII